ncbi:MAG: STAS domain-containing protein [Proteobacteria bacterium]|nr:STAS domain-containing protein [Pseudomonadota bacterium]MBU1712924.1 STAS domain-containing protein [Pseudomonadota bacterium]
MQIKTGKEKNMLIVSVKGKIDTITAPEFEKTLFSLITQGEKNLLLNFSELDYINSAGLRSILVSAKQLKVNNGKLSFSELKGPVKEVFKISGFSTIFDIFDTQEDALK